MIKNKNKNEYYHTGNGLWVRNFTKTTLTTVDINDLYPISDIQVMLENELQNRMRMVQQIETEHLEWPVVVIAGDGFNFIAKQKLLDMLPPDVVMIGVNDVMNMWAIKRRLNYYVVNNPYPEAMRYLPKRPQPRPRIIASERTHPGFIQGYDGIVYQYTPSPNERFGGIKSENDWLVDDYRNPICAAICLAFKFNVKKLLLFCCDNSFKDQRVGAEKLHNGLWMYPQQQTAHSMIDGCLYWLQTQEIEVRDHSSGPEYKHAEYITDSNIPKFVTKE
jgi:hypothetical protein